MSVTYDWCGHRAESADAKPCGAPIDRWSREWKHRNYELDADHKAIPEPPVGPLEEGLHLRADRYAAALAAAAAADARVTVLTDLLVQHEYARSEAESALNAVQADEQIGTVYAPTGPEPENVHALLCLLTGSVYYRINGLGYSPGWRLADQDPSGATTYEWPIRGAGPFIAWSDAYGYDKVLREAARRDAEFNGLHRMLSSLDGYRGEDGGFARPNLAQAVSRILDALRQRTYDANTKAQANGQMLSQLRRLIGYLQPDDTQQWPSLTDAGEVRQVEVIELDKVLALLDRKDCGGEVL